MSTVTIDPGYGKTEEVDDQLSSNQQYPKVVGQLLYIAVNSGPDIAAAIFILSCKVSCPTLSDWNKLKRMARYVKGTVELKLRLSSYAGYADANWEECRNNRKSNSEYVFQYCGGTIS